LPLFQQRIEVLLILCKQSQGTFREELTFIAGKIGYLVDVLWATIADGDIEERIAELEKRIKDARF
jgi:hypothetical protein